MKKTNTYKKNKGNAGLDGVQFQISLLAVVLLNAYQKLKNWRLSSENEDAAKFDDLVLELPDSSAVLLQAKFKSNTKITKQHLLSDNSKNADFSLPKYFFSYYEVRTKFNVKAIVICTNADVDGKGLEGVLTRRSVDRDNMLHFEDGLCSFFTFNANIMPELKTNTVTYHKNNFQNKRIDASVITDENLMEFLQYLQLVFLYPSGQQLLKVIEQLSSSLDNFVGRISPQDVYKKVEDWFKQLRGEYLTEIRVQAMLSEIKSDKYCELLKDYKVSFERNDFTFTTSKRIFHVITERGHLLHVLKVYDALQRCKDKKIYVSVDEGTEVLREAIDAFELPCYVYLVVIWTKINKELVVEQISSKLGEVIRKYQYKKVILINEGDNKLLGHIQLSSKDYDVINTSVTLDDLSKKTKDSILQRKNIVFQGRNVNLKELLLNQAPENYGMAVTSEILETLLKGETVKVGTTLNYLDDHTRRYYVNRTFSRVFDKKQDDKWNTERVDVEFEDDMARDLSEYNIQHHQNQNYEGGPTTKRGGMWRSQKREETFPEENIYKVSDRLILIADSAGMGKTTILTKLASTIKQNNSHLWVIQIELNDCTKTLRDSIRRGEQVLNIKELFDSKSTTKLSNHLEEYVFAMSERVVLMLDGVDEISPDYTELILNLLKQCQEQSNFAKVFVTARSHMAKELEVVLKVKPFVLQPFTEQHQLDFLTSYWSYNLQLKSDKSKEKCKRYAKQLMDNISWTNLESNKENNFASIPLHVRMTAEVFQGGTRLNESTDWGGCKEFILGDEADPKLVERMNVTRLYDLFIEKKRDIFIDKGNPTGNTTANQALIEQFSQCLFYHQSLALEVIVGEDNFRYFSGYQRGDQNIETNLLKIGVVQKCNDSFHFVHRTFADYFVADCLLKELQQNETTEFQTFLIDTIFLSPQYNITRIFFDSLLQKVVGTLPCSIFEKYQCVKQESTLEFFNLQSMLLHIIAGEGCVAILQLILKCIDFKVIPGREINITTLHESDFDDDDSTNVFSNTLNLFHYVTGKVGINIRHVDGFTPLHCAARNGHLDMVKFLVQHGAKINSITNDRNTALHYAAGIGKLTVVEYLVEVGVRVATKNNDGWTALHAAVQYGNLNTVKFLVQFEQDFNVTTSNEYTLLHIASENGHLDTVKFLLELGLDSSVRDNEGFTALHAAALCGKLDTVKFLVEYGLDCNATIDDGSTLLHIASARGHLDTIKLLVGYGIDLNVTNNYGSTPLHIASANGQLETVKLYIELGSDCNVKDSGGFTAMHVAALCDKLDILKFLLEYSVDFNITNSYGSTMLHLASENGHLDIVKFLLEIGLDCNVKDDGGFTALHVAAQCGQLDTLKFLMEYGMDLNDTSTCGFTLLHLACVDGQLDTVKYLLELGMDSSIKDDGGFTAIHVAARHGQLDIVKFFAECGADFNVINKYGATPLHLASENGNLETVEFVLGLDINYDMTDSAGCTALHLAVRSEHLDIVKLLVRSGVDLHVKDKQDRTALNLAVAYRHLGISRFLKESGADSV